MTLLQTYDTNNISNCHSVPEIVNGLDKGRSPSYRKMFSICKMKLVVITSVYVNFDGINNGPSSKITKNELRILYFS